MHIHILGICGTFMGGIATIARGLGHKVTGSDLNVYPPMSTMLEEQGIEILQGFDVSQLKPAPDVVIIGNALSRGNTAVEYVLNHNIPYKSGPQWLSENVLQQRWVLAVAGTHGKTTTSSMLAWILEANGMKPGFLIGGVAKNFGVSASLGESDFFVIEADEYDTAFFDKRSKFVHYHPRTVVLNNLEFDHADIFPDIAAIQTQFHHLIRTIPENGLVIYPKTEKTITETLDKGCWTPTAVFSDKTSSNKNTSEWQCEAIEEDYSQFNVIHNGVIQGCVKWNLMGQHNMFNGLAAIIAARHIGITTPHAIETLTLFEGIKRRMEKRGEVNSITVYDDFAHHPTAIKTTLDGLRRQVGKERIIAVLEPRSNTMKQGVHASTLAESLELADIVFAMQPDNLEWDFAKALQSLKQCTIAHSVDAILEKLITVVQPGDHVLIMSNGGFGGIHKKLLDMLESS